MDIKLDSIMKLPRPKLIFLACVLFGGIAPGFFVLLLYWPEIVSQSGYLKLLLLSALVAGPVIILSFVVISVMGHATGKPRNTRTYMNEFTFSLLVCLVSYGISLLVCYLFGFPLKVFIVLALVLAVLTAWYFITVRETGNV